MMLNFTYHNPTTIVFGKGSIAELPKLVPAEAKVLMTYGGGSIKRNGVYEQVIKQEARVGAVIQRRQKFIIKGANARAGAAPAAGASSA